MSVEEVQQFHGTSLWLHEKTVSSICASPESPSAHSTPKKSSSLPQSLDDFLIRSPCDLLRVVLACEKAKQTRQILDFRLNTLPQPPTLFNLTHTSPHFAFRIPHSAFSIAAQRPKSQPARHPVVHPRHPVPPARGKDFAVGAEVPVERRRPVKKMRASAIKSKKTRGHRQILPK